MVISLLARIVEAGTQKSAWCGEASWCGCDADLSYQVGCLGRHDIRHLQVNVTDAPVCSCEIVSIILYRFLIPD
jgi:hypothetical protein